MKYKVLGPCIYQYEFDKELAKDLTMLFENQNEGWTKSGVGVESNPNQAIRTSQELPFEQVMPLSAQKVKEIYIPCVDHYCSLFDIEVTQDEGLNLLKYEEGIGKYDYHSDTSWQMYRSVSGLIYLNPQDYEGGETHFKHFDISVHPEHPSIVLFPSNYAYLHSAFPVTSGTKYILVTWMNDMPQGFDPYILTHIARSVGVMQREPVQHNH